MDVMQDNPLGRQLSPLTNQKSLFKKLGTLSVLFRASAWLSIANILTGLLGYGYQVLMGRMLSPSEFALFSSVMALSMFFSSPLFAMQMVVSRRVSSFRVKNMLGTLWAFYQKLQFRLMLASGLFILSLIPLTPKLQLWLKSDTLWPIWIFGFIIVFSAFMAMNRAFFQGNQWFGCLGGIGTSGVFAKIIFSALLISAGFGVEGALGGALLSCIFIWLTGKWIIFKASPECTNDVPLPKVQFPLREVLPVLIANIAFSAMTQLDMVLVNWFFPSDQAGIYAAASVLGKAVLYLPGGLVLALYPLVAENHTRNQGSAQILVSSVLATLVACGIGALLYWMQGPWLIKFFYGAGYAGAGQLLRWYGIAILPLALVMVAEHFLIAKGKVLFAWLFLAMAPLQIGAIYLWHTELIQVLAVMGGCGAVLVLTGYGMLWYEYQRSLKNE